MNRKINKVAVIGSGIMGSGIACHFANIGIEVLLLDIVPNKLSDVEIKKNLSLEDNTVRNRIVTESPTATKYPEVFQWLLNALQKHDVNRLFDEVILIERGSKKTKNKWHIHLKNGEKN